MNKQEFMTRFKKCIRPLPHEEYAEAVAYFENYFADAESEADALKSLKSPEAEGAIILANFACDVNSSDAKSEKTTSRGVGYKLIVIFLAILAAPIALPIAIALACAVLAIIVALLAVFVSVGIALPISGIAAAIASFSFIASSPATTLFFVGFGIALVGIGILAALLVVYIAKKFIPFIAEKLAGVLRRRVK